ncbi:hypothetical protein IFR05_006981 [Cadophora sp. M221]|nr:hypothetical protein IFR05_006981 [Cadophora sp. M221]
MHWTTRNRSSADTCDQELGLSIPPTRINDCPLTPEELKSHDAFFTSVFNSRLSTSQFASIRSWYSQFLYWKFRAHWHLLRRALRGLDEDSPSPRPGDLVTVYNFLATVGELLKTRENLALVEVVDELDNNGALKEQLDRERSVPNQVVFAAIGWLSMLYDTVPNPKPSKLEALAFTEDSSRCRAYTPLKNCVVEQGFDYIDQPLHVLLNKLGIVMPEATQTSQLEKDLMGCPARESINDLAVSELAGGYKPNVRAPFFGIRLLDLQRLVRNYEVERKACGMSRYSKGRFSFNKSEQGIMVLALVLFCLLLASKFRMC